MTTAEDICRQYLPLVTRIAGTYWRQQRQRKYADREDLIAAGQLGLLRAFRRWDRTTPFYPLAELAVAREVRRELGRWSPYFREVGLAHGRATQRRKANASAAKELLADELNAANDLRWSDIDNAGLTVLAKQEAVAELSRYGHRLLLALRQSDRRGWVSQYLWWGRSMPDIARGAGVSYQRVQQVVGEALRSNSTLKLAASALQQER